MFPCISAAKVSQRPFCLPRPAYKSLSADIFPRNYFVVEIKGSLFPAEKITAHFLSIIFEKFFSSVACGNVESMELVSLYRIQYWRGFVLEGMQ